MPTTTKKPSTKTTTTHKTNPTSIVKKPNGARVATTKQKTTITTTRTYLKTPDIAIPAFHNTVWWWLASTIILLPGLLIIMIYFNIKSVAFRNILLYRNKRPCKPLNHWVWFWILLPIFSIIIPIYYAIRANQFHSQLLRTRN